MLEAHFGVDAMCCFTADLSQESSEPTKDLLFGLLRAFIILALRLADSTAFVVLFFRRMGGRVASLIFFFLNTYSIEAIHVGVSSVCMHAQAMLLQAGMS